MYGLHILCDYILCNFALYNMTSVKLTTSELARCYCINTDTYTKHAIQTQRDSLYNRTITITLI